MNLLNDSISHRENWTTYTYNVVTCVCCWVIWGKTHVCSILYDTIFIHIVSIWFHLFILLVNLVKKLSVYCFKKNIRHAYCSKLYLDCLLYAWVLIDKNCISFIVWWLNIFNKFVVKFFFFILNYFTQQ